MEARYRADSRDEQVVLGVYKTVSVASSRGLANAQGDVAFEVDVEQNVEDKLVAAV